MSYLVLSDAKGRTARVIYSPQNTSDWSDQPLYLIQENKTQRVKLVLDLTELEQKKLKYDVLQTLDPKSLTNGPVLIGQLGALQFVDSIDDYTRDESFEKPSSKSWVASLAFVGSLFLGIILAFSFAPRMTPKIEQDLKTQVIKIMKNAQVPPPKAKLVTDNRVTKPLLDSQTNSKVKVQKINLSRRGALSVLGQLNSSKQKGGLNLGAVQTSRGPGLGGGTQGSGGTQTSIYAKGMISAPLGSGQNLKGAGGYGTHGKGGGQAGFGDLKMTGSLGATALPVGQEAVVASGLDRDAIAAVIARNQGQVRFCYEQGLRQDPSLSGRVVVDFVIGGNGLVKSSKILNSSLGSAMVEDCISLRLKSWKFPLPDGGVDVKVSYPFTLRRAGQG